MKHYKEIDGVLLKRCSTCLEFFNTNYFHKGTNESDGLRSNCKGCSKKYITDNAERYKLNRVLNKKRRKEYNFKVKHKYDSKRGLYNKTYRERHPVRVKESKHRYAHSDKGKITLTIRSHRRVAKIKSLPHTLTKEEWLSIINVQGNKCNGCGTVFTSNIKATIDHIIPVNKNGGLTKDNVQALCLSCNSSKCDRLDWTYSYTAVRV